MWSHPRDDAAGAKDARMLFQEVFASDPTGVWAAPGRVNLIGEHVDYAGGISIPFALPHSTFVAASLNEKRSYRLVSEVEGQRLFTEIPVAEVGPGHPADWSGYAAGAIWAAAQAGLVDPKQGMDLAIVSDVPLGSGLSSSAALECSAAIAAVDLSEKSVQEVREELISCGIRAENEVVGASTGGLDQTISLLGKDSTALVIDFQAGTHREVACGLQSAGLVLLVIDSCTSHSLSDGNYASRRGIIDAVTAFAGVTTLRELEEPLQCAQDWAISTGQDPELAQRRVRHVIEETQRTAQAARIVDEGRWEDFGALMNASHDSLRDLYEVSTQKLDVIVETARAHGALGARLTGGGFGGSAIALLKTQDVDAVAVAIQEACSQDCRLHVVEPAAGARRIA